MIPLAVVSVLWALGLVFVAGFGWYIGRESAYLRYRWWQNQPAMFAAVMAAGWLCLAAYATARVLS